MLQFSHQRPPQFRLHLTDSQTAEMDMKVTCRQVLDGHHRHKQQIPDDHALFRSVSRRGDIHNLRRYNRKNPRWGVFDHIK